MGQLTPGKPEKKHRSARLTLALVGLAALAVIMGLFAAGSYVLTERRLTAQRDELWSRLQAHLGPQMARTLWVYDLPGLRAALADEIGGSVLGMAVVDDAGKLVAQHGAVLPVAGAKLPAHVQILRMDIPMVDGQYLGHIDVAWSDAALRSALNSTLLLALAQLVGVSLVLLAVVWVGVNRLIFRRMRQLQQALDGAASGALAADMTTLPVTAHDEFGAITRSINAITARLGQELEAGRASEQEAHAALRSLQAAQEDLVRAEKMASLGRLVAGVAHELNTPIGNIVMVASTQHDVARQLEHAVAHGALTRTSLAASATRISEGADLILGSARRAAGLIQNFKQVAVDQTSDQLRDFDLAMQTEEVLSVISHVLSKTPIQLVRRLEPGIAMHSYPGPLGQVVTNLVMNAVHHGFQDVRPGTITVGCTRQGDLACITVTDDGIGIAPEHLGKIFDPFFTTKLGQGGTGLGLHISHNMVYGPLGGQMSVHSTPGVGTTFTVLLPRTAPDATASV